MNKMPQVLTIAGSDSGGGAGIQADLKTFQMRQVFGTSVITAITAQNTLGVHGVQMVHPEMVTAQIEAIGADFQISAFKIGMLGTAEIIETVAKALLKQSFGQLILDPVMIAKGGAPLLQENAIEALRTHLLPRADVLTPNLPEAEVLTNKSLKNENDIFWAGAELQKMGAKTVIIKGGHFHTDKAEDWVFLPDGTIFSIEAPRFLTEHTHGTGCTFSACLTAELGKNRPFLEALQTAKDFITQAIAHPLNIGNGHGPVNHWAYSS